MIELIATITRSKVKLPGDKNHVAYRYTVHMVLPNGGNYIVSGATSLESAVRTVIKYSKKQGGGKNWHCTCEWNAKWMKGHTDISGGRNWNNTGGAK